MTNIHNEKPRYVDLSNGILHVSGKDSENEAGWGFKYNNPIDEKETDIDPVLYPTEDPCVKKISFKSKVKQNDPNY